MIDQITFRPQIHEEREESNFLIDIINNRMRMILWKMILLVNVSKITSIRLIDYNKVRFCR
ncbi:hypothetical protein [Candidatus Odyssella thessalonicensis]|uniref:hypothetical protein n=1 Tax=Candidatus Odyssella thessalonicensis TaxID=84647 RepID=UPI000225B48E|nr:hypothetical protein [Candidatus Odyssella thessalonicensis]